MKTPSSVYSKIGRMIILAGLALALLIASGQFSQATLAQQNEPDILLRQAAQRTFENRSDTASPNDEFEVKSTKIVGNWAFVNFKNRAAETEEHLSLEVYTGLARWNGAEWEVALQDSDEFLIWLDQIPEALISTEARQYLRPTASAASNAPNLWLPFPVGETWSYYRGPHPGCLPLIFCLFERAAVDFAPHDGADHTVTAAGDGVVIYRGLRLVVLQHLDGWQTGYYSLSGIGGLELGQVVHRGEATGQASKIGYFADDDHVHFWVGKNGFPQRIEGQTLSDWTIYNDNEFMSGYFYGHIIYKDGTKKYDSLTVGLGEESDVTHFADAPLTADISGWVSDENSIPIADVAITTDAGQSAVTDAGGYYIFNQLPAGTYTLTPTKTNCIFSSAPLAVTIPPDAIEQNFTGTCEEPTYSISGQVADINGDPISDVSISTGQGYTATTDMDGNYAFSGLAAGDYTLTPNKTGCTFEPATLDVPVASDVAGQNFTGTCEESEEPTYSIFGQVADINGNPISDVSISTGQGYTATTDMDGNYAFSSLLAGDYTLTPNKTGCTFEPATLDVPVASDVAGQNFTGTCEEPTGDASIFFEPNELQIPLGGAGDTQVQIRDVSNLYGFDFKISYDPAIVEVVDADLSMSGVQIAVGSIFAGQDYFVARNWVYTDTGVIEFSASLRDPATPINGSGSLASITWLGLNPGISNLTLEQVKLSDRNSYPIAHSVENGLVEVIDVKITGSVYLQGRSDHSGTNIFLLEEACSAPVSAAGIPIPGMPEAVTDANGYFEITPYPGRNYQCLQAFKHGYLVGQKEMPQEDLGAIQLPGGDVTEDDLINIFDLALIASQYGGSDPTADINADGVVDIYDLVIAAGNYDKRGPVTDWQK